VTPAILNRPGLSALAYRLATHSGFLRRMLARVPGQRTGPDLDDPDAPRPLAALTARTADDPAVAVLDAWATVADVLTFYQERIANEGFLRTATERRSVLELARTIGYELNPGVAASTYLAFTVEDAKGAPGSATVEAGTKVLSIPAQNQRPQTFETLETIQARAEWNALRPRTAEPQPVVAGLTELWLEGLDTRLQPGDPILLLGQERVQHRWTERWDLRVLTEVTADIQRGLTLVRWQKPLGEPQPGSTTSYRTLPTSDRPQALALRLRAALFGYNAPDWRSMPVSTQLAYAQPDADRSPDAIARTSTRTLPHQWPGFTASQGSTIDLDGDHPRVLPDSWLVLTRPGWTELYRATATSATSRADFGLSAKVTRVVLDTASHLGRFGIRNTVVLAESEELTIASKPVTDPVEGSVIELDRLVEGLAVGQPLAVSGKRVPADATAATAGGGGGAEAIVSEVVTVRDLPSGGDHTTIVVSPSLAGSYQPETVTICANVARASHGETVREVLGGGDGATPNQRFTLRKPPLTYLAAPTATGGASTLEVLVNAVRWQEAPSLYGLGPDSRSYTIRLDDDANATLTFGDGQSGARLPSGQENVTATYRSGIGPDGEVAAGAVSLLQTRPLGIRGVSNPVPATGSAAPETLAAARLNAPLTVVTLDRIVSLPDFGDFARAFAGIGKALAIAVWNGQVRVVRLVVAGERGEQVLPGSATYDNLVAAIARLGDPLQPFEVVPYRERTFRLTASVLVEADRLAADVAAAVQERLATTFSFDARAFGQPVTSAEVIAAVQAVEGVIMVDLEPLTLDPADAGTYGATGAVLTVEPTDVLVLDPAGIDLGVSQ